jgi:hypothetical protein
MITGHARTQEVFYKGEHLPLQRSLDLYNHSPDGFSWGYKGSAPAQLALALLLQFTDEPTALRLHQQFKAEVIAALPMDQDFALNDTVVRQWVANHTAHAED